MMLFDALLLLLLLKTISGFFFTAFPMKFTSQHFLFTCKCFSNDAKSSKQVKSCKIDAEKRTLRNECLIGVA
jgi:hypothetical protein